MGESPNSGWMDQWQVLARQYASAWHDASRGDAGAPSVAAPAKGFEQWSRLFAPGAGSQGETIERLVDSTKSYATYMQSLLATATANAQGSHVPWGNAFAQGFAGPVGGAPLFEHPAARAWREMAEQGGNGFAPFAGAGSAPITPDLGELKAWLSLPTFGSSRERQEHSQKMAVSAVEYQEQMNRYNVLMLKASQRGFELFEGKLAEREQPGRQIESLRALYDLWVDAAEEGYAEIALSAEFREVYGALVNAQMRVRAQMQQEVERIGTELGMPTRSEVNSIGERLQALRREVRARGTDALAGEVAALRQEFAVFKGRGKRAHPDTDVVERAPAQAQRKAAATGKHAAPVSAPVGASGRAVRNHAHPARDVQATGKTQTPRKVPATKKVQAAEKAQTSRRQAPKNARPPKTATPANVARAAGAKKAVRRATVIPAKTAPAAPTSGARNFASRIAKFANASLGASRARAHRPEKRAKSRSGKAR